MCGRARCTLRPHDVPSASHRHGFPARFLHLDRYRPSYNVAPGSYMPVLRKDNEVGGGNNNVAVHCMKWGLVPSFTKKTDKPDFFKMFNARSESVDEKASFRRLLPKNRCLVAVDGFYEWKKEGSKKQPYYIHFSDGRPLVFAALFDSWQNSGGETLYTFTILTTASSTSLRWLHDRMPVILGDKDSVDTWLDDPTTLKLKPLLAPYENSDLVWYPVTPAIGKPTFDGPECIQQIPLKSSQNSLISKFFVAKQPKAEEDKEIRSTDKDIPVDLKEESTVEGYEGAVFSDSIKKEPGEEKENVAKDSSFQKIMKAEPFIEDNLATSARLEDVKIGPSKETGESNASVTAESYYLDLPRISKEESEVQDNPSITTEELNQLEFQHEAVQDKEANQNQKMISTFQTSEKTSGKGGTKQGFEAFPAQEKKPLKHSESSHNAKSCGKRGRKEGKEKSNNKKSKETQQSTLHFFFNEK